MKKDKVQALTTPELYFHLDRVLKALKHEEESGLGATTSAVWHRLDISYIQQELQIRTKLWN